MSALVNFSRVSSSLPSELKVRMARSNTMRRMQTETDWILAMKRELKKKKKKKASKQLEDKRILDTLSLSVLASCLFKVAA